MDTQAHTLGRGHQDITEKATNCGKMKQWRNESVDGTGKVCAIWGGVGRGLFNLLSSLFFFFLKKLRILKWVSFFFPTVYLLSTYLFVRYCSRHCRKQHWTTQTKMSALLELSVYRYKPYIAKMVPSVSLKCVRNDEGSGVDDGEIGYWKNNGKWRKRCGWAVD